VDPSDQLGELLDEVTARHVEHAKMVARVELEFQPIFDTGILVNPALRAAYQVRSDSPLLFYPIHPFSIPFTSFSI